MSASAPTLPPQSFVSALPRNVICMTRIFTFFLFAFIAANSAAQISGKRVNIPGTGVEIVPPPGVGVALAGPTLIDKSGETFITFVMSDSRYRLDTDPTWRQLFARPPEKIEGALAGNLLRRTRAADGGGWDGWMLTAVRGSKVLTVTATYTGTSADYFQRIRDHLLTITWNDAVAEPEFALGVSLNPRGLQLVRGTFGALAYNVSGVVGSPGPMLMIQATPMPPGKVDVVFPAGCQPMISEGFGGRKFVGPTSQERPSATYCEGWSKEAESEMHYIALVRLKTGALLNIIGSAPPASFVKSLPAFRDAVSELKLVPGRSPEGRR